MNTQGAANLPAPSVTWYRQRSLPLLLGVLFFLTPLLALPLVLTRPTTSQPLALRGQSILRIEATGSGSTALLYVQTASNLWRSPDDGNSWLRADQGLPATSLDVTQLLYWTVSAANPEMVFAVAQQDGEPRLFWSADRGDSWQLGGRWTTTALPLSFALASSAQTTDHLYLAQGASIWHSADRGRSWDAAAALPASASTNASLLLAVDAFDPARVYVSAGSGLWRSADAGASWQPAGDLPPLLEIASLAAAPARSGEVFAGGRSVIFHSLDGGLQWTATALPAAEGRIHTLLLDPRVSETLFALDEADHLFRSDDAGQTWQMLATREDQPLNALALNPVRRNRLYSAGNDGIWFQPVQLLLPTATPTATASPTPTATATATATATTTPTATATATPTVTPTATPTVTPPATPTATKPPIATPLPTRAVPTATRTAMATAPASPSALPVPSTPTPAPGSGNPPPPSGPTPVPTSPPAPTDPPVAPTLPPTPPPR